MREAFGGGFMIKLMLVFIVVYTCFMAVAIQCAKTFRIKNNVINILEQQQYGGTSDNTKIINNIDKYLEGASYNMGSNADVITKCGEASGSITDRGVCISNPYPNVYKVTAYVSIAFPFFDIYLTLPISGETKIIN